MALSIKSSEYSTDIMDFFRELNKLIFVKYLVKYVEVLNKIKIF